MFTNKQGNCYNFSAAFWYLAKTLDYKGLRHVHGTVYEHHGAHAWCEVEENGVLYIFDPTTDKKHRSFHVTFEEGWDRYEYNPGWEQMPL